MKKQDAVLQYLRAAVSARMQEQQSIRRMTEILGYDLDAAEKIVGDIAYETFNVQNIGPKTFQRFLNRAVNSVEIPASSQLEGAAKKRFYVLALWHDMEPSLIGPFETEEERDAEAGKVHAKDPMSYNGCFRLNCVGPVEVDSYCNGELEELANETTFINYYRCDGSRPGHTNHKLIDWTVEHDCACDDRCPICNAEITPYKSKNLED